jgi:hypothetical protein
MREQTNLKPLLERVCGVVDNQAGGALIVLPMPAILTDEEPWK